MEVYFGEDLTTLVGAEVSIECRRAALVLWKALDWTAEFTFPGDLLVVTVHKLLLV